MPRTCTRVNAGSDTWMMNVLRTPCAFSGKRPVARNVIPMPMQRNNRTMLLIPDASRLGSNREAHSRLASCSLGLFAPAGKRFFVLAEGAEHRRGTVHQPVERHGFEFSTDDPIPARRSPISIVEHRVLQSRILDHSAAARWRSVAPNWAFS